MSIPPPLNPRSDWEPVQDSYNLQLWSYDFYLRALAQVFVNTVPDATLWLTYTDEERIQLVEQYTAFSITIPSSVYLPYLYQYALTITHSTTPEMNLSDLNIYFLNDSRWGGAAGYQSPTALGTDNYPALLAILNAIEDTGTGGVIMIPPSPLGYYFSQFPTIRQDYTKIFGYGIGTSRIVYEPSTAGENAAFKFFSSGATTLVGCEIGNFTLEGFNPDLLSLAAKNNRHKKIGILPECVSHLTIHPILIKHWATGSSVYGVEGGSEGITSRGKEFIRIISPYIIADRPMVFEPNTREPSSFSVDEYHITDFDFRMPIGADKYADEAAITFVGDLDVHELKFSGKSNMAGGSGGVFWDNSAGTHACNNVTFSGWRAEQQAGSMRNIDIRSNIPNPLFGLVIDDITMSRETEGIYLDGCRAKISNCFYPRFADQDAGLLGIEIGPLGAESSETIIDNFLLPDTNTVDSAILYDWGTKTVQFTTADEQVGFNQLASRMTIR